MTGFFMTIWQRLGIEPTNDIKEIKRAYGKQLQIYHPEEDAEGYQALREAYDRAIKLVNQRMDRSDDHMPVQTIERDEPEDQEDQEEQEGDENAAVFISRLSRDAGFVFSEPELYEFGDSSESVDEFIAQAIAIYDHFPTRISRDAWIELLNSKIAWDIFSKDEINRRMFEVLKDRCYLPQEVWQLLEGFFGWRHEFTAHWKEQEYAGADPFLEYYDKQLAEPGLSYEFLLGAGNIDYDRFLSCRYKGFQALFVNDLKEAGRFLEEAYGLFADDPDLLRLLGEYYLRKGNEEQALQAYGRQIRVVPDEMEGYLARARILFRQGQYAQAVEDYQWVLSRVPHLMEAKLSLGHCWLKLGQEDRARTYYLEVAEQADPASLEAVQALQGLAHAHPEHVRKLYNERKAARREKFKQKFSWLQICVFVLTLLSLGWYVQSLMMEANVMKTASVTSLDQLENTPKNSHVAITLTDVLDVGLGLYELQMGEMKGTTMIQGRSASEKNLQYYGFAKRYIYIGSFEGQHIVFLSEKWLGDSASLLMRPVTITGYARMLKSTDVESAVSFSLLSLPAETEKPLKLYPKYIEEGPQLQNKSMVGRGNSLAFYLFLCFVTWGLRLHMKKKKASKAAYSERTSL
ncbi:tetratricopeptide repeat protein [Paenibacillus sp. FSL W8-0186]|uniref:J domain-containing protein n=1 Tax=Paenibacillus sp. FSL W8-0186 TaxID=2921709 RepID=UPI0030CA90FF